MLYTLSLLLTIVLRDFHSSVTTRGTHHYKIKVLLWRKKTAAEKFDEKKLRKKKKNFQLRSSKKLL